MENTRFLKFLIGALLLINLSTLAFFWFAGPPRPKGGPGKYLVETLQLDDQQQIAYTKIREEHQQKTREYQQELNARHKRLFDLLATPVVDSVRMLEIADSISIRQKAMELYTFEHFRALRAICRPEQQQKFDAIIGDAVQQMGPPPGGRPRR